MKRYVILAIVASVSLVLFLEWLRKDKDTRPKNSEIPQQTVGVGDSSGQSDLHATESEPQAMVAKPLTVVTNQDNEFELLVRKSTEAANLPVAFYGMVVDQDSNALQNVTVDLAVFEERVDSYPEHNERIRDLKRLAGADGRFEVVGSGLKGRIIEVSMLTKEGYEQEFPGRFCGMFGTQSTSFDNPAVLRMWSTNLHDQLITGDKTFNLIPDGRHYAIDLVRGTITEGKEGDLVAWIRRPESVQRGERFDWSCELAVPAGGLLESQSQAMFIAPEGGFTNLFAFEEQANSNGPGCFQDKRFYVQLRNGQVYGRIVISLYPNFSRTKSGLVQLSYAVNPSGSRLLR